MQEWEEVCRVEENNLGWVFILFQLIIITVELVCEYYYENNTSKSLKSVIIIVIC